jgi:hypothetical protein
MATGGDEAESWEQRWRDSVGDSIKALTASQQQTAILLERITTRLTVLEEKPGETRQWFATFTQGGGCLAAVIMACIAVGGILSSAAVSIIIALIFHP